MSAFTDRTALITGAASGIGMAVAQHLAANGAARLILVDRDPLPTSLPCERVAAQDDEGAGRLDHDHRLRRRRGGRAWRSAPMARPRQR